MLSEKEIKTLDEILERFGHDATRVIGIMQEIQKVCILHCRSQIPRLI